MKLMLVVDPEPAAARMLEAQLRLAAVEVLAVASIAEGARLALECRPDLALIAADPPGWEGFNLAYRLREEAPEIPVLLLSSRTDPWVGETARALRARHLLPKPVRASSLLPPVLEALGLPPLAEDTLKAIPDEADLPTAPAAPPTEVQATVVPPSPSPPAPPPSAATPQTPLAGAAPAAPRPLAPMQPAAKILVVEDDRHIAKALALRLRAAGLEVVMAYDALGGLEMAMRHLPDLVILDIGLPAGSGLKVAERIQTLVPKLTPIIFLTASRQPGLREQAERLGPADYIEKPYDAEKLLESVRKALTARS